jgi:hypothetical protein
MGRLLFKVKKPKWNKQAWPDWVPKGEIPADCLKELRVENNRLSVWLFDGNPEDQKRIVTALAANRPSLEQVDFLVFEETLLQSIPLTIEKTNGDTPDSDANSRFHRDLIELTGAKLLALATAVGMRGTTERITAPKIREWLREAIANERLDVDRMDPDLRTKLAV